MKKKILLSLFIISLLFTITGCGNSPSNNESKKKTDSGVDVVIQGEKFQLKSQKDFYEMHYLENYVDFYTDQIGSMRVMSYEKNGSKVFEIRVMYDDSRSLSEMKAIVEAQNGAKEQTKKINNIDYVYYEYTLEDETIVHHYIYSFNGKVYSIGFFLSKDSGNIEDVFMKNVSFK